MQADERSIVRGLIWRTQVFHLQKSSTQNGRMSSKLRFWSLTPKSYESELQPQKPQSSIAFRPFRKAQITLRNGRPLKMLSQASAFSSGRILGFLTGKRSKNHAAMS